MSTRQTHSPAAEIMVRWAATLLGAYSNYSAHLLQDEVARDFLSNYKSRFIDIGEGMEVHYQVEGEGVPLILIHGFGSSLRSWNSWTPLLKAHFKLIRMDLPGFGLSAPPAPELLLTPELYLDYLIRFLDALGIDDCHLAGNSLGGWSSWELALKFPKRVKKMVLLAPAGYFTAETLTPNIKFLGLPEVQRITETGVPRFVAKQMLKNIFGNRIPITKEMIDAQYYTLNREGNLQTMVRFAKNVVTPESHLIKKIETPSLIIWGDADNVIPVSDAYKFKVDLKNSDLMLYKNVGHAPMVEIPERTAHLVLDFLTH